MQKGFTLVELLVVATILLLLFTFALVAGLRAIERSYAQGLHSITASALSLVNSQCLLKEISIENNDLLVFSFTEDYCKFSLYNSSNVLKLSANIPIESENILNRLQYLVETGENPNKTNTYTDLVYSSKYNLYFAYDPDIVEYIKNWHLYRHAIGLQIVYTEKAMPNGLDAFVYYIRLCKANL